MRIMDKAIGKSGSGKSFFLKNFILNEWANGTRVVVLDPEAEYITDPKKAKIVTVKNLFEDEDYAEQFNETASRFGIMPEDNERSACRKTIDML